MASEIRSQRILLLTKGRVFSLAAPLYLSLSFFRFYVEGDAAYFAITLLSTLFGLLFLFVAISQKPVNPKILVLISVFVLASLIAMLSKHNNTIQVLPQFLSHIGFAWALLYAKLSTKFFFRMAILVVSFFFIHAAVGTSPDEIFVISRNYVSIIVLISLAFYFFSCQQNGTVPSLLLLLMAMLILMWATGRAGILSGAIVLLGTFMISGKRLASAIMLAVIAGIAYSIFRPDEIVQIEQFTLGLKRMEMLGLESKRELINEEYYASVTSSFSDFIFGVPLDSVHSIVDVDGNPHNSYISLHVAFGLIGTIAFLWASSFAMLRLIRTKNFYLTLMLTAALFRTAFDSAAFQGPLDVVIFYCIFFAMKTKPSVGKLKWSTR